MRRNHTDLRALLHLAAEAAEEETKDKEHRANAGEKTLTVETVDNHVYFYADVDSDRVLALMRAVKEIDRELRNERISRQIPDDYPQTPIWLHIHSNGGDVFAGLSAADQLRGIKTPIFSVIEGMCASAATLIAISARRRYIMPSAFMLIHQISAFAWGTHEQFKDEMRLQEMLMETLMKWYSEHSKLDPEAIREMLRRDSWMNAQQALEAGFVDAILESEAVDGQ